MPQIRNSLKWNLTKERSRGEALIQRPLASPLYEAHVNNIISYYIILYYYVHKTKQKLNKSLKSYLNILTVFKEKD